MSVSLPCGLISSPLIQMWKETVRTPEMPFRERCRQSIKTRKEKIRLFSELKFHFLTVSCWVQRSRSRLVWSSLFASGHSASQGPTWGWVSAVLFGFHVFRRLGTFSGSDDRLAPRPLLPKLLQSFLWLVFMPFFSLPFCLPLTWMRRLAFLFVLGKFTVCQEQERGQKQGYK